MFGEDWSFFMNELRVLMKFKDIDGRKIQEIYRLNPEETVEKLIRFLEEEIIFCESHECDFYPKYLFTTLNRIQQLYDDLYEQGKIAAPYYKTYLKLYERVRKLDREHRNKPEEELSIVEEIYGTIYFLQDIDKALTLIHDNSIWLLGSVQDQMLIETIMDSYFEAMLQPDEERYQYFLKIIKGIIGIIEKYPHIENKMAAYFEQNKNYHLELGFLLSNQFRTRYRTHGLLITSLKRNIHSPSIKPTITVDDEIQNHINDYIFTIDNENTNAKEDAISFRKDENGIIVTLYTTNVASILHQMPHMETTAFSKWFAQSGNHLFSQSDIATYFSLEEQVPRDVVTYQFQFDLHYHLLNVTFGRANITVDKNYTYQEANAYILKKEQDIFPYWEEIYQLMNHYHQTNHHKMEYKALRALCDTVVNKKSMESTSYNEAGMIVSELKNLIGYYQAEFCDQNHIPIMHYVNNFDMSSEEMKQMIENWKNHHDTELLEKLPMQSQYRVAPAPHRGIGYDTYAHCTTPLRNYLAMVNQNILIDIVFSKQYQKINYYQQYLQELEEIQRQYELRDYEKKKAQRKKKNHKIHGISYQKEIELVESYLSESAMDRRELLEKTGLPEQQLNLVLDYLKEELHIDEIHGTYHKNTTASKQVGVFQSATHDYGFARLESGEKVLIPRAHMNGAVDGSTVLVETYGKEKQKAARVIRKKKTWHKAVGDIVELDGKYYVHLNRVDYPSPLLVDYLNGAEVDDTVVVEVETGKRTKVNVVRVIGNSFDPHTAVLALMEDYNITPSFPEEVMEEARKVPNKLSEEDLQGRLDLRAMTIFTIDGKDAKDFDDAVSIEKHADGSFRLGVHIADVSHYVKEDSFLDLEARNRGTSVYAADLVAPMLPEELSNNICSLKPYEDRLTLSCFMEFDPTGVCVDYDIVESVIRSKKRMTYEDVNRVLEGERLDDYIGFQLPLYQMLELSHLIRNQRKKRGALSFELPKTKFVYDEDGFIIGASTEHRREAERIIEDFMIAANECFAQMMKQTGKPCSYRIHLEPEYHALHEALDIMDGMGYKVDFKLLSERVTPMKIQQFMRKYQKEPNYDIVEYLVLHSMNKAVYGTNPWGHFGLATSDYLHGTSPIRRYADLVAHRAMKRELHQTYEGFDAETTMQNYQNWMEHASSCEQNADLCERAVDRLKTVEFLQESVGKVIEGKIVSIGQNGMVVRIDNAMQGFIPRRNLEGYLYYGDILSYVHKETKQRFALGETIQCVLESLSRETLCVELSPVTLEKNKEFVLSPTKKSV